MEYEACRAIKLVPSLHYHYLSTQIPHHIRVPLWAQHVLVLVNRALADSSPRSSSLPRLLKELEVPRYLLALRMRSRDTRLTAWYQPNNPPKKNYCAMCCAKCVLLAM